MSGRDTGKLILLAGTAVAAGAVAGAAVAFGFLSEKMQKERERMQRVERELKSFGNRLVDSREEKWLKLSFVGENSFRKDVLELTQAYRNLLKCASTESEQILERDIERTMPLHPTFMKGEPGQRKLRNVLIAFSRWDTVVGYVQGMNYIAANLLLHCSEENAFVIFVNLMQNKPYNLRKCFENGLPLQHEINFVATELTKNHFPHLAKLFDSEDIPTNIFIQEWVTLYTYSCRVSDQTTAYIWDLFMEGGWSIIYRVWIALLGFLEKHLMKLSPIEMVAYLHTIHKPDDRLGAEEVPIKVPEDLLERAIHIDVDDAEIKKYQKLYREKITY